MSATRLLNILQGPHVTEKTSQAEGNYRNYAFKVLPDANKLEVRQAVEQLLKVKVHSVRICRMKLKSKRRKIPGQVLKCWKKAYVALEPGQEIDLTRNENR